jgi:hypothetical protein
MLLFRNNSNVVALSTLIEDRSKSGLLRCCVLEGWRGDRIPTFWEVPLESFLEIFSFVTFWGAIPDSN